MNAEQTGLTSDQALTLAARSSFEIYCRLQYPPFQAPRHIRKIIEILEAAEKGQAKRVIIAAPPRHGKSLVTTSLFPSWYMGRGPDRGIIVATYGQELAEDFGGAIRNNIRSDIHRKVFPECEVTSDTRSKQRFYTTKGGTFYAVGRGGPITGRGAHCIPGSSVIQTEHGPKRMSEVITGRYRVLSFNHESGSLEWKRVVAYAERRAAEFVELRTEAGRRLLATPEHRIFDADEEAYKEASEFSGGERIVATLTPKGSVSDLRRPEDEGEGSLPEVLRQDSARDDSSHMLTLRQGLREASLSVRKIAQERARRFLLFVGLLEEASCVQESQALPHVRYADPDEATEVLQCNLQTQGPASQDREDVPGVRDYLLSWQRAGRILYAYLCGQGPLSAYAGPGQLALQGWNELCALVPEDATAHYREGSGTLSGMRRRREAHVLQKEGTVGDAFQLSGAPHRRGPEEQQARESGSGLLHLPRGPSQVESDTVSVVRRVRKEGEPVYDIQVEGSGNFFADDVLVHNCLLIDDPLKDRAEAASDATLKSLHDWFSNVAFTRLAPSGVIIVIATRWSVWDLSGWLLSEHKDQNWELIEFPAEAKENDPLGRQPGEPLWPERYDEKALLQIKDQVGPEAWLSLYQQEPTIEGGMMFHRENFRTWKVEPPGRSMNRYIVVDPANSKKKDSDRTVMWVVGAAPDKNYYILDGIADRLDLPERMEALFKLHRKWKPRNVGYEEYGLQADIAAIRERQESENYRFRIEPLTGRMRVTTSIHQQFGPRVSKKERIKALQPLFLQERIWFPPELMYRTKESGEIDLTKEFLEKEYVKYPAVRHDDMLDCLAWVLDDRMGVIWPMTEEEYEEIVGYRQTKRKGSWMSVALAGLAVALG